MARAMGGISLITTFYEQYGRFRAKSPAAAAALCELGVGNYSAGVSELSTRHIDDCFELVTDYWFAGGSNFSRGVTMFPGNGQTRSWMRGAS